MDKLMPGLKKRKTPIVFCFDDHMVKPAAICLTSLLANARASTFFDIFILHNDSSEYPNTGYLDGLKNTYANFKITYRNVGKAFESAFRIRGISQATYYRLLIPEVVPEYDVIMYHDVDIIFRSDVSELFERTDMTNHYVGGVVSPAGLDKRLNAHITALGVNPQTYIYAGNLIINSSKILADGIMNRFKEEVARSTYEFQDMDIINVVCQGKIKRMPPEFCGTIEIFDLAANQGEQQFYTKGELQDVLNTGIVHYNGPKPWKTWCPNFDIWWEYYRKSGYFDAAFYYSFYASKLEEYDQLSLLKRVRILLRYFKTGKVTK